MAGWVPFRCATLQDSLTMWGRMLDVSGLLRPIFGLAPNAYILAAVLTTGMLATWAWVTYAERVPGVRGKARPLRCRPATILS